MTPLLVFLIFSQAVWAQNRDFESEAKLDEYVRELGPMDGHTLQYIVDTLTKRRTLSERQRARALYTWIGQNIDYDCRGDRSPGSYNASASQTLNLRKGNHLGVAHLFEAMAKLARLHSTVITGHYKSDPRHIRNLNKWTEHSWNGVQINGKWCLVDASLASGTTDRKCRFFTRDETQVWFCPDPKLFVLSHYPDRRNLQYIDTPVNKAVFTNAPIIDRGAMKYEIYPASHIRDRVRAVNDTTTMMKFVTPHPEKISQIMVTGRTRQKVEARFEFKGDSLFIRVPFFSEGTYPFNLYVNDELAFTYSANVRPARKPRTPSRR